MRLVGALVLIWSLSARVAHANSAAVIAVGGSPEVSAEDWTAGVLAVTTELERRGYSVPSGAVRDRGHSPQDCIEDAHFEAERVRVGADVLCIVSVFASDAGGTSAGSIVVALRDTNGSYTGEAEVESGTLDTAARRAVTTALDDLARGGQPWLALHGEPYGALVVIDGVERGVLPWEGAVGVGEHRVEVRLGGYVPLSTTRTVAAGPPTLIDVALVREGAVGTSGRIRPWYSIAGPIVLGGAALALLAVDVAWLAQLGCVERAASGVCLTDRRLDAASFGIVGVAALASIAGAILWLVLGEEDAPQPAVALRVGPGSVSLEGRY